jgi:hypothetical protein
MEADDATRIHLSQVVSRYMTAGSAPASTSFYFGIVSRDSVALDA